MFWYPCPYSPFSRDKVPSGMTGILVCPSSLNDLMIVVDTRLEWFEESIEDNHVHTTLKTMVKIVKISQPSVKFTLKIKHPQRLL